MKKAKWILALIGVISVAFAFGCDAPPTEEVPEHTHKIDLESWGTGSDGHWRKCKTCSEKLLKSAHTLVQNGTDYVCQICGYTVHEHKKSGWQFNDESHFKACLSDNCDEVFDTASHTLNVVYEGGNEYNKCSVCGYESAKKVHSHSYVWSTTDETHKQICTACQEQTESVPHNFTVQGESMVCSDCGKVSSAPKSTLSHRIVNMGITSGNKSTKTYSLDLSEAGAYDKIKAISANGIALGTSLNIPLSLLGTYYGETEITVTVEKSGKEFVITIPVTVVTNLLSTPNELNAFMTWADSYSGTVGDYSYDGYYMLANDITYTKTTPMPSVVYMTTSHVGFKGVLDGAGHTVDGLRIYDNTSSERGALVSNLALSGVIKDIAFVNAQVGSCSFLTGFGYGTVENVFVQYSVFGCNANGAFGTGNLTSRTSTFGAFSSVNVKNCVIDMSYAVGYNSVAQKPGIYNANVIGLMNDEIFLNGVYVVGAGENVNVLCAMVSAESVYRNFTASYNGGNYYSYANYDDFFTYQGKAVASWGGVWSGTKTAISFNGNPILAGNPRSLPTDGVFVSKDKSYSDYVIVYDNENSFTADGATLIAKQINRATGTTSATYDESHARFQETVKGGILLAKTTSADWVENACFIVVGNEELARSAGVEMPEVGKYKIEQVGNSVFILASRQADYNAAVLKFLEILVDYKTFSFEEPSVAELTDGELKVEGAEGSVAFEYRMPTGYYHRRYEQGYNAMGYISGIGGGAFHNSLKWLPKSSFSSSHSSWYATNCNQLCYSAHGKSAEYQAMVQEAATRIKDYLLENPDVNNVGFTHEDENNWCTCLSCLTAKSKYGSNAGQVLKFINDVTAYMDANFPYQLKGRDYTVYCFAYQVTADAPKGIVAGPRTGVIIAEIRAYFLNSIYDSVNDVSRNSMLKWNDICSNIGVWLYDTVYHSYFFPYDCFEPIISWFEFCANKLNVKWFYLQSIGALPYTTSFDKLKNYISSRAGIEIKDKVVEHGTVSDTEYQNSVKAYLKELEDAFFAEDGYYGKAGGAMRNLYNTLRTDYRNLVAQTKSTGSLYERTIVSTSGGDYCEFVKTDNVYFKYWKKSMIDNYLSILEQAYSALNVTDKRFEECRVRVMAESVFPRFVACTAWSTNATYGCKNCVYKFVDKNGAWQSVTGTSARQQFFDDALYLHIDRWNENSLSGWFTSKPSSSKGWDGMFLRWATKGDIASFEAPTWAC